MSPHTQPPWKAVRFDDNQVVVLPERDDLRHPLIATVSVGEGRPDGYANAAVVVAAPLLLEALESMAGKYHLLLKHRQVAHRCRDIECTKARTAILKAMEEIKETA